MKRNLLLFSGLSFIAATILISCASKPPTAFEKKFMDATTNYTPVVSVQTNVVTVVTYRTNEQNVIIPVTSFQTNSVTVTNIVESYVQKPGAGAAEVVQVGGAVGNIFGVGGLVSTGLAGLFSLWGWIRSSKKQATAVNLAQTIETLRSFVQQLPNGGAYDSALTQWMQQHQADANVLNQVLSLLANDVSNPDAKVAAEQIRAAITALNPSALPPVAKV